MMPHKQALFITGKSPAYCKRRMNFGEGKCAVILQSERQSSQQRQLQVSTDGSKHQANLVWLNK